MRIGLVLGGGGLTGTAFHAGLITALWRTKGWDARTAEVIVGTSAGSTSAALMRAGFPPDDYVRRILGDPLSPDGQRVLAGMGPLRNPPKREPWRKRPASPELLRRVATRPWQYPPGTALAALLPEGTLGVDQLGPGFGPLFQHWPDRPMWITAVSLTTGQRAVFGRTHTATVADAVSASCAIPGYFRPVTIDGDRYVDGGAHSVHNADLLADSGVDVAIVSAPLSTADWAARDPGNLLRVPVRRKLERELALLRDRGIRTLVFAPDARLRTIMGTNSMVHAKRRPVALAALEHAALAIAEWPL